MDVRVDRKGRLAECLRHHHARGLVSDAREFLQRFEIARHFAAVLVDDCLREALEALRFSWREAATSNQFQDFSLAQRGEFLRRRRATEECGRDAIHLRVGRLSGEDDGDEQRERIAMLQRNRRKGIKGVEDFGDACCFFLLRQVACPSLSRACRGISGATGRILVQIELLH